MEWLRIASAVWCRGHISIPTWYHYRETAVWDTDAVRSDNGSLPISDSLHPNLPQFYVYFSFSVILNQIKLHLIKNLAADYFFLSIYKYILPEHHPCFRLKSMGLAGIETLAVKSGLNFRRLFCDLQRPMTVYWSLDIVDIDHCLLSLINIVLQRFHI